MRLSVTIMMQTAQDIGSLTEGSTLARAQVGGCRLQLPQGSIEHNSICLNFLLYPLSEVWVCPQYEQRTVTSG